MQGFKLLNRCGFLDWRWLRYGRREVFEWWKLELCLPAFLREILMALEPISLSWTGNELQPRPSSELVRASGLEPARRRQQRHGRRLAVLRENNTAITVSQHHHLFEFIIFN